MKKLNEIRSKPEYSNLLRSIAAIVVILGVVFIVLNVNSSEKPNQQPAEISRVSEVKTPTNKAKEPSQNKSQPKQQNIQGIITNQTQPYSPPTTNTPPPTINTKPKPKQKPQPEEEPEPLPPFSSQLYLSSTHFKTGQTIDYWINANRDISRCKVVVRGNTYPSDFYQFETCVGSFSISIGILGLYEISASVWSNDGERTTGFNFFAVTD